MKKKVLGLITILVIVVLMFSVVKKEITNSNATKSVATAEETMEITNQGLVITASGLIKDSTADADIKSNTEYLQGLIDEASAAGGGTVHIPANTYYFAPGGDGYNGAKYVIKCKNNVKVEGEMNSGTSYTILRPYGTTTNGLDMFYFNDYEEGIGANYLENADFEDFTIDGAYAKAESYKGFGRGFAINLYKNCEFESVTVQNTEGTGFELDNPINSTISNCAAEYCGTIESEDYEEGSGIRVGTGYTNDEYIYINKTLLNGNKNYGIFFKHKGLEDSSKYNAAESKNGFVVADCYASANAYDFGGEKAYDVTYMNCYSGVYNNVYSESIVRFDEGSVRTSVLNCESINTFTDIDNGDLFLPIYWATYNGIASGYARTEFKPNDVLLKQDSVALLFRLAKRPGNITFNEITTGFEDIDTEEYCELDSGYLDAIKWAKDEGLVSTKGNFEPYSTFSINRFLQMLWLYDQGKVLEDYDYEEGVVPPEEFDEEAYDWGLWSGIITYDEIESESDVFNDCTRGYAVTMLYRYVQSKNEFSITYNLQGGTVNGTNPSTYEAGTDTFTLINPTKEGYTFAGWIGKTYNNTDTTVIGRNCVPETSVTLEVSDTGYKTYTAIWTPKTYTISFDANGGTGEMEDITFIYDNPQALLKNKFTKEGYVFTGWNTKADGTGTSYSDGVAIKNLVSITLYAQWEKANITYQVEHWQENLNEPGYTLIETDTYNNSKIGDIVSPETKLYEGFTTPEIEEIELTEDGQIIKYYYRRNSYTVSLHNLGGGVKDQEDKTYKYGEQVVMQLELINGYRLLNVYSNAAEVEINWMNDQVRFIMPARGFYIETQSELITYTITYNLNGGTVTGNPETYTVEDENIVLNAPTKEGYVFIGWTGSNGTTPVKDLVVKTELAKDLELTANWVDENTKYVVHHYKQKIDGTYAEQGDYQDIEQGKIGDKVTGEIIQDMVGFTSPTETKTITLGIDESENIIEYYYERNSYTLTITEGRGIKSSTGEGTYKYEEDVELSAELKAGYENPIWTDWTGSYSDTKFKMPAWNIDATLNATPITYTITYNLNGGTVTGNPETYTVESEDIILKDPTKEGYEFTGWTDENGNEIEDATILKGTTGNLTLTANWEKNKYKVEVTKGKGIEGVTGVGEYEAGQEVTLHTTLKPGYKFSGCDAEDDIYDLVCSNNGTISFTMPAHDVTVTINSTTITYIIEYELNGGHLENKPEDYTVESGNIVLGQPTKEGYEFTGWTDENGNDLGKDVTIPSGTTGNKTYTANWEVAKVAYKVEHYKQLLDGTYAQTPDYTQNGTDEIGKEITGSVRTCTGFKTPETQKITLGLNAENNVIIYRYERESYNITVTKGTGIERVTGAGQHKYGETIQLQAEAKAGYGNVSWSGDYNSNEFTMPAEDVEMRVNAELIEFNIHYELNGGMLPEGKTNPEKYTVETPTFTLENPTKEGYEFIGWTGLKGENLGEEVTINKGSIGDLTYIANWEVIPVDELVIDVSYSTTALTNQNVTVTIKANNKIEPVEGWTLSEDEKSISKIYEQNGSETVTIVDEYGQEKQQLIEVTNIDKIPPEVEITYEKKDDHVVVTAKANEKVKKVEGWEISEDKQTLTKTYYLNKEEEFTFTDLAGNETKKTVKITSIVVPEDADKDNEGKDEAGNGNEGNNNGTGSNNKPGNAPVDKDTTGGNKTDTTVSNKDIPAAGLKYILGTGIVLAVLGILSFAKMKKYKDIK